VGGEEAEEYGAGRLRRESQSRKFLHDEVELTTTLATAAPVEGRRRSCATAITRI
jgi:hypothetical protein